MFQSNFDDFFLVWTSPKQALSRQSSKLGPDNSILHPKHAHNVWDAFIIVSYQYVEKYFRQILTTIPGTDITGAGKAENRVRITRFYIQNIPTLFGVRFLLFPVNISHKCFSPALTTFPGSDTTGTGLEHTKLKTGFG